MKRDKQNNHGNRCSCQVLASIVGGDPSTISFAFCRSVLMKHWDLDCNHGCKDAQAEITRSDKWRDVGQIDPVKAILIKNE
jgi:hypothetical protein